ncbi:MAG TPA: NAD(P)-binding domain-containing protein, partial [Anaeromyxobacteraceae bacterium]|nr:NAD(P)-binding domain-containing protein [Anaeromyxobacteraceae bacterium]
MIPRCAGIVGLGLMGASLARALRAADPSVRVLAVEPSAELRARAVADRVADEAYDTPTAA